jgi:hypothetical protein
LSCYHGLEDKLHSYTTLLQITCLFAYPAAVRKEIQDETDRITGKSKQISNIPIHLSIYSPNGLYFFIFLTKY